MGALALLGGIPRWGYEALAAIALVVGIYVAGMHKEKTIIQTKIEKQIVQVEHKVVETDHSHDKELTDLRAYRAAHPLSDFSLCVGGNDLPPSAAEGSGSAAPGGVQPVPSGNSGVQPARAGRPIGAMLEALAGRADQVSATLRRRQTLEP